MLKVQRRLFHPLSKHIEASTGPFLLPRISNGYQTLVQQHIIFEGNSSFELKSRSLVSSLTPSRPIVLAFSNDRMGVEDLFERVVGTGGLA